MLHISLFSGIGGFDLASEWAGWKNVVSCEISEFPRKILQYYWPESYHHDDIKTLTYNKINEELTKKHGKDWRSDDIIISGGFPCQPYSTAGKRLGKQDERHLWPEMLRVIREIQPSWVVGENVFGLVNWSGGLVFDEVQSDLEAEGYEVQAYVLPACAVNAPHRRDRVWFVAYSDSGNCFGWSKSRKRRTNGDWLHGSEEFTTNTTSNRRQWARQGFEIKEGLQPRPGTTGKLEGGFKGFCNKRPFTYSGGLRLQGGLLSFNGEFAKQQIEPQNAFGDESKTWHDFPTQSPVCRRDDGLSSRLDGITFSKWRNESLKGYGNAIVPQVAYQIFKTINEFNNS